MLGHEPAFPYRLVLIAERKRERFPLSKPVLVPFLGPALGPRDFVFNSWAPKRYLKMEPKQCPKLDPNQDPKTQSRTANFVGRRRQGSCRHDLQSVACSAILFNCLQQTENFNQRTKDKLRPRNLLKQREGGPTPSVKRGLEGGGLREGLRRGLRGHERCQALRRGLRGSEGGA